MQNRASLYTLKTQPTTLSKRGWRWGKEKNRTPEWVSGFLLLWWTLWVDAANENLHDPAMSSAPTKYTRQGNFTQSATQNNGWTTSASTLDAEFNALKTVTDKLIDRLDEIQRDDGALENGVVTLDSCASALSSSLSGVAAATAAANTAAASATTAAAAANAAAASAQAVVGGTVFGGVY